MECVNHDLLQPYPVLYEKPGNLTWGQISKLVTFFFEIYFSVSLLHDFGGDCAGDLVAHIKFTVLLMPNGSDRITSHTLQELHPTKTVEDDLDIKAWLALGTKTKKKGGGKKKKGGLH